jgi:hypothetical protein
LLYFGSCLELSIVDHKIVLTPTQHEVTLEDLLAGSPKKNLQPIDEDREWQEEKQKGKEF